jgi:hypothetical protein
MRIIRLAAMTFTVLFLSIVGAHADGTWCANYKNGGTNCGFYSFEQCEAARSGNGGFAAAIPSHPLPPNREGAIGVDRQKKAQLAESHGQFPSMLTHGSTTRTL